MAKKRKFTKRELSCLICGDLIEDTEFEYEDYYTVFRGHNGMAYKGSDKAIEAFICFDCYQSNSSRR